jgi:hypothetical protein
MRGKPMKIKEQYQTEKVKRSTFNFSDYNPRTITKDAREKLKKSIRKYGILQPFIVNSRTGNLVGGHQRLEILDEINGTMDYEITICKIDVDEREEVKINIVLNNQGAQGEFDPQKLQDISVMFPDIDFKADLLFDQADMDMMSIQVLELQSLTFQENTKAAQKTREQVIEDRKKIRENNKEKDQEALGNHIDRRDNFITLVFNSNKEKYDLMQKLGVDGNEKMISFYKFKESYDKIK